MEKYDHEITEVVGNKILEMKGEINSFVFKNSVKFNSYENYFYNEQSLTFNTLVEGLDEYDYEVDILVEVKAIIKKRDEK